HGSFRGRRAEPLASDAAQHKGPAGHEQPTAPVATRQTRTLEVNGVPGHLTGWVDSFNVGLAGLLLLGSLFFRGNTMSVFVIVGAAVAVAGHRFGIRSVEPLRDYHVALMLGSVLALVGFRTARQ